MATKAGLQRVTKTQEKFNLIMQQEVIDKSFIKNLLTDKQADKFYTYLTELVREKRGVDKDKFMKQIEGIVSAECINDVWEVNHERILIACEDHIRKYGAMPHISKLSELTGISRKTIGKHLSTFEQHTVYQEKRRQVKIMEGRIFAKVIQAATQGNMKAARLYFELTGGFGGSKANTQNNYIQINQLRLSQEAIQLLKPEQLNLIEDILNGALPVMAAQIPATKGIKRIKLNLDS